MHWACNGKQLKDGRWRPLLKKQFEMDIDAGSQAGDTPLHLATMRGFASVVDILIRARANINVQNLKGMTPLHVCQISLLSLVDAGGAGRLHPSKQRGRNNAALLQCQERYSCTLLRMPGDRTDDVAVAKDDEGRTAADIYQLGRVVETLRILKTPDLYTKDSFDKKEQEQRLAKWLEEKGFPSYLLSATVSPENVIFFSTSYLPNAGDEQ
eukprot:340120-Hanusia_phi.AAC.5